VSFSKVFIAAIFSACIFFASMVTVAVLFPSLLIRIIGGLEDYTGIDAFETGLWTWHWLAANTALGILAVLYKKNRFPQFAAFVRFATNFEVSAKVAFIVIAVILVIYIPLSVHEIFEEEVYADYHRGGKETIESWQPSDATKSFSYHVRLFLDYMSMKIFGNYKVVPFVASIAMLILTYYATKQLASKRFAGLVAFVLVLQSGIFLLYDTSLTYDNYWILFYLLSLYVIHRVWVLSPVSFVLSILSKHISVLFVPMTVFYAWHTDTTKKSKAILSASYVVIMGAGFFVTKGFGTEHLLTPFEWHDFWMAFNAVSYQLRYDGLVLVFLMATIVWSFIAAAKGTKNTQTTMILILGSLLSQPLLAGLTIDSSEPYRHIAFIVFFAIAVGVLFSKPKADGSK
jgi:hypothetical protein